jgi:hypothetical protein
VEEVVVPSVQYYFEGRKSMNQIHVIILIAVAVLWLSVWIAAVVNISSARLTMTPLARGLWIAVAIILPLIGPLAWFAWGRTNVTEPLRLPR